MLHFYFIGTGYGVVTDKVIEERECITYYSGEYLKEDPGTSKDAYVFQVQHKRKIYW